jgi:transposase-like protein
MAPDLKPYLSPEEAESIAAGIPKCPNCNGQNTRTSVKIGIRDALLALLNYQPYRCRVCQHRYYKRVMKPAKPPAA